MKINQDLKSLIIKELKEWDALDGHTLLMFDEIQNMTLDQLLQIDIIFKLAKLNNEKLSNQKQKLCRA